ncbi:TadE family protein [Actinoplanes sp. NPDC049316]|uniref:TadE family protein n=1 Tax=Actinoplanes sp. NPDC049316 TaxID=3154727 RepID=UPI003427B9C1
MNTGRSTRRRRRLSGDRGAVTVEVAGYTLLMLLALLIGVQAVTWGLAALGARYTANHAAQQARVHGGTAADGKADANTILASTVGTALNDPHVDVNRSATEVTVTVRGTATSIIPGFHPPVTVTVHAPVERIN